MLIPKINVSTIDNVSSEFFRKNTFDYIQEKTFQLVDENLNLISCIKILAKSLYVDHDDCSNEEKIINEQKAVALALIVVNLINTEMEIEWLKD